MASIAKVEGRAKPWKVRIRRKGHVIVEYFRTKREASDFAAKVEADWDKWSRLLGGELRRHTLADLIDRFMGQWTGKDQSLLARMAWWRDQYGDRTLAEFNGDTVREGLATLEEGTASHGGPQITGTDRKRSPATINRYKAAISSAFKAAIDKGWFGVRDNPAAGIRHRKENNSRFGRKLEDDERARLLAACDESAWPGLGVLVRLALATGGRRGELLGLQWKDVDLASGKVLFLDTKNGEDRAVPVIAGVMDRLREWGKVRRLGTALVFPSTRKPSATPDLDWYWRKAKADAGIENLRFHDLRHSCGSYLAQSGASAFEIAAVLGHRSGPALTARYVHLVAEDSRDLLEKALGHLLDK